MRTNEHLDRLGESPFTRLTDLLAPLTPAANRRPILLSLGEPQHPAPALLAAAVAANADKWNQYPPVSGAEGFRRAAAAWLTRRYDLPDGMIDPDRHILALSGTKEGLFLGTQMAVPRAKAGAQPVALMPNPYYLVYVGAASMAGATVVPLPASADTGFLPDFWSVSEDILARTAIAFLCTPANPQGTIADLAYLQRAITLAREYDFVLVIDECYSEIWDRAAPPGGLEACRALGGSLDNVLVFNSLSKRSNAAGLRAGFVAGDPGLIDRFRKLRGYSGVQVPLPLQAAAAALLDDDAHVLENRARYRGKLDLAERVLGDRFGFYRPPGGFFLWLDVGDSEAAAVTLWRDAAIKVLPGAYIGRPDATGENPGRRYIRVALVHEEAVIAEALDRFLHVL